jgi:hypothetical protein
MTSNEVVELDVEAVDAAVAAAAVQKHKARRAQWFAIEVESLDLGEKKLSYPFLEDSNVKDLVLVRQLLVDKPFLAGYGQVIKCWDDFTSSLNKTVDDSGQLIFDPPVKTLMIKHRFEKIFMPFVNKFQNGEPYRSGCDDQPPPTEIQQGLESLFQQWNDNRKLSEGLRDKAALDRKKGNAMGEALRRKALGEFVPKPPDGQDDASFIMALGYGDEDVIDTPLMSRTGHKQAGATVSASSSGTGPKNRERDRADELQAVFSSRTDFKMEKEANKKRKLELKEKKFAEQQKEKAMKLDVEAVD